MSNKEKTTPVPAIGTSKRLLQAKAKIAEINNDKVILQNKVTELEKDLSECKQKYHNTYNELVLRKDDINILKFELEKSVSQGAVLQNQLDDLKKKHEENAPTCKKWTAIALGHDKKILQTQLKESESLRESLQTEFDGFKKRHNENIATYVEIIKLKDDELDDLKEKQKNLENDNVRLSNLCIDLEKRLMEADSNLSEAEKERIRYSDLSKKSSTGIIKEHTLPANRSASSKDRIEMKVNDNVKVSIEMESHLVVINSYVGGCIMTLNLPTTWAVSRVLQHVYSILESDIK